MKNFLKIVSLLCFLTSIDVHGSVSNGSSLTLSNAKPGFNGTGYASFTAVGTTSYYESVTIDSLGRIIAVGARITDATSRGLIVCYNPDGTLNTAFGTNGYVVSANFTIFHSVKIDSNGKIVVGGIGVTAGNAAEIIARYTSAGALDTSFAVDLNGVATTTDQTKLRRAYGLAFDLSGNIVVVGDTSTSTGAIARYTSAGLLDTTFNSTGYINDGGTTLSVLYHDVIVDSSGGIIAVGEMVDNTVVDGIIVRYTSSLILDSTFTNNGNGGAGVGGRVRTTVNPIVSGVVVDSSGKIVVVGTGGAVERYKTDGKRDTTFNFNESEGGGYHNIGNYKYQYVTLDLKGKIIAVGSKSSHGVIVRYDTDGRPHATFNKVGYIANEQGEDSDEFKGVAVDSLGRIVVVGKTDTDRALIARYFANGKLDALSNWNHESFRAHHEVASAFI